VRAVAAPFICFGDREASGRSSTCSGARILVPGSTPSDRVRR
jgi:hypothetical protein